MQQHAVIEAALKARRVVVSITGPAAGQSEFDMRQRKLGELDRIGYIFWGISSWACSVSDVRDLVAANGPEPSYVLFFAGGTPTSVGKVPNQASHYSLSRERPSAPSNSDWKVIPDGIQVRNVRNKNALALILGSYLHLESPIACSFADYTFFKRKPESVAVSAGQTAPSLTHQGRSTVCAEKGFHGQRPSVKQLVGIATLCRESAVWVKA